MDREVKKPGEWLPQPEYVHLRDFIAIIKKRKWVVIFFSIILVAIVTAASLNSIPLYQATAQIAIMRQPYPVTNVQQTIDSEIGDQFFYKQQCDLLKSRSLVLKVIEDLDLWKDSHGPLPNAHDRVEKEKTIIVDWYLTKLTIEPVRESRLINISFWSASPETAARVANAHARLFIDKSNEVGLSRLTWLKTQLQDQKKKVESSQGAMQEYKKTHNITSFEDRQNIVSQKLLDLNASLTKAKSERLAKEGVYRQLRAFKIENENIYSLPEVAQDSVILNLRNQLIQLRAKRLEMASNYGPRHPKMIDLNSRIEQLQAELTGEVHRLGNSIKAELDRALAYEGSIQKSLDSQKGEALAFGEKAMRYGALHVEAESNQQIYDSLLKQAKELGLVSTSERGNVSIVDKAEVPLLPAKPKTFLNIMLSVAASMFMGPFLAFFLEYMDRTIRVPDDVRRRLGMPVLGALPFYRASKKKGSSAFPWAGDQAAHKKNSKNCHAVENFSVRLIQGLQAVQQEEHGKVLFVEGCAASEGKTTVLANAAVGLAKNGIRVLMIDADIVKPSLHEMCDYRNEGGLRNIMEEILSHEVKEGDLEKYSIDDLFFLIAAKKLNGRLIVKNGSQTLAALFDGGRLLHLEDQERHFTNLGAILLREGFLSEDQMKNALAKNEQRKQPLGYILINCGYIRHEQLQKSLRLLMEDRLQKLFSWKYGTFSFEPMNFRTYEDERIFFEEDYTPTLRRLGQISGSRFPENMILSRITQVYPNVSLLPSGTSENRITGPVYQMLFSKFLDITKRHFDIILVDTPPLLDVPDVASLSSLSDRVIFVIKAGNLPDKTINEAITRLKEVEANILGTVINQAKISQNYYKY